MSWEEEIRELRERERLAFAGAEPKRSLASASSISSQFATEVASNNTPEFWYRP